MDRNSVLANRICRRATRRRTYLRWADRPGGARGAANVGLVTPPASSDNDTTARTNTPRRSRASPIVAASPCMAAMPMLVEEVDHCAAALYGLGRRFTRTSALNTRIVDTLSAKLRLSRTRIPPWRDLPTIPGNGVLTALLSSVGNVHAFRCSRQWADVAGTLQWHEAAVGRYEQTR